MSADYETDFTECGTDECDGNWNSSDTSEAYIDTTNDYLHHSGKHDDSNYGIAKDLRDADALNGADADDEAWVLRGKVIAGAVGGSGQGKQINIGLMGLDETNDSSTADDTIHFFLNWDDATDMDYRIRDKDNDDYISGNDGIDATDWDDQTFYFELIRLTATTYKVNLYSDEFITSLGELNGTCASTTDGLRYIKINNRVSGAGGGSVSLDFDYIKFYDGVTEVGGGATLSDAKPTVSAIIG